MAKAIDVGAAVERPTHHAKLSRSGTEIGLILCDGRGGWSKDMPQIRRSNQGGALKTYQGQQKHVDQEFFTPIVLDDFSGGRGKRVFEEDQSRYFDGQRVDTLQPGRVINGPQETFCTGDHRDVDQYGMESVTFKAIYGDTNYRAKEFESSAAYNMAGVEVILRRVGTGGDSVVLGVWSKSGGAGGLPDTSLKSKTLTSANISTDVLSVRAYFEFATVYACLDATDYFVVAYGIGADEDNHWEIACNTDHPAQGFSGHYEIVGGYAWSVDYGPHFRVLDDTPSTPRQIFEYKGATYFYTQPLDGANSFLHRNGWRGAADANTGALDTLADATQTGWSSADVGSRVIITRGPGSSETQPWRTVTAGASGVLTVSPDWNIEHTTSTEYVVVKSDTFDQVQDLGAYVTDHCVAGEYVYFARGDEASDSVVLRYQEYNAAGTWTVRDSDADHDEVMRARYLEAIFNPSYNQWFVWGANNEDLYYSFVWWGKVPYWWDALYGDVGVLAPTGVNWSEVDYANVGNSSGWGTTYIAVLATFGTGDVAKYDLGTAVDITGGDFLYFRIKSSVACAAGDLIFEWCDAAEVAYAVQNIPALAANTWTWVRLDIDPSKAPAPDETAVKYIKLNVHKDNGLQYIWLDGNINVGYITLVDTISLGGDPITGMGVYVADSSSRRQNPWVLTAGGEIFEIQTQNGNIAVPLPLGELKALRSFCNGRAFTTGDVYAWFSLGRTTQRLYDGSLTNLGPEKDAGLPENRRGQPSSLVSYPGKIYEAVDAGEDKYSSVLVYKDNWHEVYRARQGERIYSTYHQAIPGQDIGRMWISQGADILFVPTSLDPEQDANYPYVHESVLQAGRIHFDVQDVTKFLHSLTLSTENLSEDHCEIKVDYRTDSAAAWTLLGTFHTSPYQEIEFDATTQAISGKWLELRFRSQTDDNSVTPVMLGAIVEGLYRFAPKPIYTLTFRLAEGMANLTLRDERDDVAGHTKLSQLDTWLTDPLPLKLNTNSSYEDDIWVIPLPLPTQIIQQFVEEDEEVRVAQIELVSI